MSRRWLLAGFLVLLVLGLFLLRERTAQSPLTPPPQTSVPSLTSPPAPQTAPMRETPTPDSSITLSALSDPAIAPEKKVRRIFELLQNYSTVMKSRSRIPLSTNAEITRALTGKNSLREAFLSPDHPSINAAGELVDAWDTPYFFHALAADKWEVASAGPDRIFFNNDDIIFPPSDNPSSLRPVRRSVK